MVTELYKHITVHRAIESLRRQAEAIIKAIEQEAIEAARVLGFETISRERLMDALDRDMGAWERKRGRSCSYLDEHRTTAPRECDRAVCVAMIGHLLTIRDEIDDQEFVDNLISECNDIDSRLKVLRCRLARATAA